MKNLALIFIIATCILSCKQNAKDQTNMNSDVEKMKSESLTLEGVWELVSFYYYKDNVIIDTVINKPDNRQVKMYIDGKVMWSRRAPSDAIDFFGYGSYKFSDSTLTETLDYGSVEMLKVIDTMRVFTFEFKLQKDAFTQIDLDYDGNRIFSENYRRVHD
jgi:hypothetical protein